MQKEYVGILDTADPLYSFLVNKVLYQVLKLHIANPVFDVYAIDTKHVTYRYIEQKTSTDIVCKFYGNRQFNDNREVDRATASLLMQCEFQNLRRVWQLGLTTPPHRVVRPFAVNDAINAVLVEEYVSGLDLDSFIKAALFQHEHAALKQRVTDLSAFLATLHGRSQTYESVDPAIGLDYLTKVIRQLADQHVIDAARRARLEYLSDRWAAQGVLAHAPCVLVHGDVTPVNIMFGDNHEVIAIDLERMQEADAAADLGSAMAELQHAYFRHTHNPTAADSLIDHVVNCYATQRRLSDREAAALYVRCRFFAGSTLLRIARNAWLDFEYRQALSVEADRWLQS